MQGIRESIVGVVTVQWAEWSRVCVPGAAGDFLSPKHSHRLWEPQAFYRMAAGG
jgi:hypothetical protein